MKKVVIIGAGPAGLFAAYELAGKADVTVLDKGKSIEQRICPSPEDCKRKCRLCAKLYGEGGAGLMSDGKMIFHTFVGNRLYDMIEESKNKQLVERVKGIFGNYGVSPKKLSKKAIDGIKEIERKAAVAGIKFVPIKELAHVGTNKLPELITKFRDDLKEKGIKFVNNSDVEYIVPHKEFIEIRLKQQNSSRLEEAMKKVEALKDDLSSLYASRPEDETKHIACLQNLQEELRAELKAGQRSREAVYRADNVFLAPGRAGAAWLENIVEKLGIDFEYAPMDFGVRVEVKREITDHITSLVRDMKFYIEAPNGDIIRTFCTCPGGKVVRETHEEGYNLVNGNSEEGDPYETTNFALLVSIQFNKPQANGNLISRLEAIKIYNLGKDKPIVQRLGEFRQTKRSKEEHLWKFDPKPSLEDITVGDNSLGLSHRHAMDVLYGMNRLNKLMPGLENESTLLYIPETKLQSIKVKSKDPYLQTSVPRIYAGGDGAGLSGGIVGAACCGVLAAEGILKE